MKREVSSIGTVPTCPISENNNVVNCPECAGYVGVVMDQSKPYYPAFVKCELTTPEKN